MAFSFLKNSINSHHGVSFYLVIGVIVDWQKPTISQWLLMNGLIGFLYHTHKHTPWDFYFVYQKCILKFKVVALSDDKKAWWFSKLFIFESRGALPEDKITYFQNS